MNKARRKAIREAISQLEELKYKVEAIHDEEQESLDNIPESLQGTERYEESEAAVSSLDEAMSNIEEAINYLEEAEG